MAAGEDPSLPLGHKDLKVVFEAVLPVAEKYEFFGIQIGVEMDEIKVIQRQFSDPNHCLLRILDTRLGRSPAFTWSDIDRALRSKSVDKIQLANSIKENYGRLFIHDPSVDASSGQEISKSKALEKAEDEQKVGKREVSVKSDTGPDRKRRSSDKPQQTPKFVKVEQHAAISRKELPSNIHKFPEDTEISVIEEEGPQVVNTGRKKRIRTDSPTVNPFSYPLQGETQSHSSWQEKEKKVQRSSKRKKQRKAIEESSSSSESDDDFSSPELSTLSNLTKSENKGLIKAFKCSFGKLCYAIKDPSKAAVELQARHLLSCSTVESLLTSPESEQVKAIALVRALKKRIKLRPVRVFATIQAFLSNEVLKEAGREIWNEAGKVCPDRTACVLGHELPPLDGPNTTELAFNKSESYEKVSDTAKNINLPDITQENAGTATSKEVSPSVPQSGLSPVLTRYKQYLQSYYKSRILAAADKYLPTLKTPYINLAMIRRGRYNSEQRDEFTRRTLHGGVDQILQNKSPIKIEDLLTPESRDESCQKVECSDWMTQESRDSIFERLFSAWKDRMSLKIPDYSRLLATENVCQTSKHPVRFILVEGPPGIGKSTFAWEVCRRWGEIESLRRYHTVVLLKLREKWVLNATSLSDLFRYPSHTDFSKSIAEELVVSQGENLLLVLDGFDEISHSFHENSVIKSILCKQLLPECTIILTTRPVAMYTLQSICQPQVDKHIEIIGFAEEERVRYITEVFSKEPELQENFLKYMFFVPHIKSMMYIPLNCAIIAQVYYESQSSRHLAIPRTRTQLYKALTHSLLVRHMNVKESNWSTLPEGLDKKYMQKFEVLAKFAFDSYHKSESKKVTFFKEDIPEELIHFGFMNESTEMYAGKGVERTFSFLHLSVQEYLAAWHLANNYSIEFQVAYHRLAQDTHTSDCLVYKGENNEEKVFISSLQQQRSSLVEPAIFLAGITGLRCHPEDDCNPWETYLNHDTVGVRKASVLLRSLYEAQNPTLSAHYFTDCANSRKNFLIGSLRHVMYHKIFGTDLDPYTPYDCYAISYCLANSPNAIFNLLMFGFNNDSDIQLVETFVKGLNDHCLSTIPKIKHLEIAVSSPTHVHRGLLWLMKANVLTLVEECVLFTNIMNHSCTEAFLASLVSLRSLTINELYPPNPITSWEWLAALKSLSELKIFEIFCSEQCNLPPTALLCWLVEHKLTEVVLDIKLLSNKIYALHSDTDILVDSVLKSVLRSNQITKMVLCNICRGTMAGVRSILLHCPSLVTLVLKKTSLGYDGILYICNALKKNKSLRHIQIHDRQQPLSREMFYLESSTERVPVASKTTCTDILLQLNNILKENTTLQEMKVQSGLFLPLSAGEKGDYCQWTGLGPLQQFNVGAVSRGISPNIRRSFSSSDLTKSQATLFWNRQFRSLSNETEVDFNKLFSERKKDGKKLFSLPSFTAPGTKVLQSLSSLDPRLKECLEIFGLQEYVERLKETYREMFNNMCS